MPISGAGVLGGGGGWASTRTLTGEGGGGGGGGAVDVGPGPFGGTSVHATAGFALKTTGTLSSLPTLARKESLSAAATTPSADGPLPSMASTTMIDTASPAPNP